MMNMILLLLLRLHHSFNDRMLRIIRYNILYPYFIQLARTTTAAACVITNQQEQEKQQQQQRSRLSRSIPPPIPWDLIRFTIVFRFLLLFLLAISCWCITNVINIVTVTHPGNDVLQFPLQQQQQQYQQRLKEDHTTTTSTKQYYEPQHHVISTTLLSSSLLSFTEKVVKGDDISFSTTTTTNTQQPPTFCTCGFYVPMIPTMILSFIDYYSLFPFNKKSTITNRSNDQCYFPEWFVHHHDDDAAAVTTSPRFNNNNNNNNNNTVQRTGNKNIIQKNKNENWKDTIYHFFFLPLTRWDSARFLHLTLSSRRKRYPLPKKKKILKKKRMMIQKKKNQKEFFVTTTQLLQTPVVQHQQQQERKEKDIQIVDPMTGDDGVFDMDDRTCYQQSSSATTTTTTTNEITCSHDRTLLNQDRTTTTTPSTKTTTINNNHNYEMNHKNDEFDHISYMVDDDDDTENRMSDTSSGDDSDDDMFDSTTWLYDPDELRIAEEAHAFLPLYPFILQCITYLLLQVRQVFLPIMLLLPNTCEGLILLSALIVNTICTILAAYEIYYGTFLLLYNSIPSSSTSSSSVTSKDEKYSGNSIVSSSNKKDNRYYDPDSYSYDTCIYSSRICMILYILNPAAIFFIVPYSESMASYFIFKGCRHWIQSRTPPPLYHDNHLQKQQQQQKKEERNQPYEQHEQQQQQQQKQRNQSLKQQHNQKNLSNNHRFGSTMWNLFLSYLFWWFACQTRSNASLLIGFIILYGMGLAIDPFQSKRRRKNKKEENMNHENKEDVHEEDDTKIRITPIRSNDGTSHANNYICKEAQPTIICYRFIKKLFFAFIYVTFNVGIGFIMIVTSMGYHNYITNQHLCTFPFETNDRMIHDTVEEWILVPNPVERDNEKDMDASSTNSSDDDTLQSPDWCNNDGFHLWFHLYAHVQRKHWNVGLLRYWQYQQIPNFLLAFPVLMFSFLAVKTWIKSSWDAAAATTTSHHHHQPSVAGGSCPAAPGSTSCVETMQSFFHKFLHWVLDSLSKFVTDPSETSQLKWNHDNNMTQQQQVVFILTGSPIALGFYAVLAVSAILGLFVAHVQISTRMIFSSCPALYWYLTAQMIQNDEQDRTTTTTTNKEKTTDDPLLKMNDHKYDENNKLNWTMSDLIVSWCILYIILGILLHPNWLPWT